MNWDDIRKAIAEVIYPEVFWIAEDRLNRLRRAFATQDKMEKEIQKWKTAYEKQKEENSILLKKVRDLEEKLKLNPRTIPYSYIEANEIKAWKTISMGNLEYIVKKYDPARRIIDIDVADAKYIVLPIDVMKEWLTRIYEFKKHIPWEKQIFDCDDHAEIMHALVAYSWYRSWKDGKLPEDLRKEKLQVAFGEAWSTVHAFNLFFAIDKDGKVKPFVYEPQTNEIKGTMDKFSVPDKSYAYAVREVYFTT